MSTAQAEALRKTLAKHLPRIGHIQIADNPGWIGCEYQPSGATEDSLGGECGAVLGGLRQWRREEPGAKVGAGGTAG